jgi:O-succinylbenzoic acid--CoA ligase
VWSDTSQREVLQISEHWSINEVMDALLLALRGDGPALAFGDATHTHVPENCAVIITTSGSTGIPKEVALSATALISSARASHKFLDAHVGERWSLLLPLTHIAGVNVLVRSLELGTIPQNIESNVEYTAIVPTQLHRALTKDSQLLEHLKN